MAVRNKRWELPPAWSVPLAVHVISNVKEMKFNRLKPIGATNRGVSDDSVLARFITRLHNRQSLQRFCHLSWARSCRKPSRGPISLHHWLLSYSQREKFEDLDLVLTYFLTWLRLIEATGKLFKSFCIAGLITGMQHKSAYFCSSNDLCAHFRLWVEPRSNSVAKKKTVNGRQGFVPVYWVAFPL